MDKVDALQLAIQDAEYWAYQTKQDYYTEQAEALKLLLDEIKDVVRNG